MLIRILERRLNFRRTVEDQRYFAELLIDLRLRDQELKAQVKQRGGPNKTA
jgi:hypothetical protein